MVRGRGRRKQQRAHGSRKDRYACTCDTSRGPRETCVDYTRLTCHSPPADYARCPVRPRSVLVPRPANQRGIYRGVSMTSAFSRQVLIVVVGVLLAGAVAWAQATAELAGRVTDESGGVLPGVTVTATQTDTGFTRSAVSDATGGWVMPNLPTGPYRLEVSLQGFRTYVQTGIVLQVGASPTINAVLAVGSLEETVSVEAAAPIVDVRSAGISAVVEQERIVELPLQGRTGHGSHRAGRRGRRNGTPEQPELPGRRQHLGRGRTAVRRGVHARRRHPQRSAELREPAAAVSRRAAGIPRRHEWPWRAERHAVGRVGRCRDEIGHERPPWKPFRVPARPAVQRDEPVRGHRTRWQAVRRRPQAESIRRDGGGSGRSPIASSTFRISGHPDAAEKPPDLISFVPTPAMLAGDFTTFASAACQGREVNLGGGFVGNRIDPARFSPAP